MTKAGEMTRTEELKLEIAKAIFKHRWPEFEWTHSTDVLAWKESWDIERQNCITLASKILHTCKEAGLTLVVKSAYPIADNLRKQGYRQTEDIEP